MKSTLWFGAAMLLGSMAAAASDTPKAGAELKDAKEILIKADEATKKVQAVRYAGSAKGTGANAARQPEVKGTVIMAGPKTERGLGKYRCEAKVQRSGSTEVAEVTVGTDGDTSFLIDTNNKTVHEDMDPNVVGSSGRAAMSLGMREYVHPEPFSDEIKAEKSELKEVKKIGSEECYQIHVYYAGGQGEAVWCFSKKDFLPRGVERIFKSPTGESGSFVQEIVDLVVDPKLPEDAFKATVPEGFKKTDEFAP